MLTASQIRAARAILNWSQTDLAKATNFSLTTIRKIEMGHISPRNSTMDTLYNVLRSSGIEFMEPDGVRRRPSDLFVFESAWGGTDFMEDMIRTARKSGGDILIVSPTAEAFAKYCNITSILKLDALIDVNNTVEIKCLFSDENYPPFSTPRFQFRTISKNYADPVPFCTYGQKYAIAVPNGEPFSKLIVVEATKLALSARRHFLSLWEKATPMMSDKTRQELHQSIYKNRKR